MTPADLAAHGRALYGAAYVVPLAARLGVSDRVVGAWADGRLPIPADKASRVEALTESRAAATQLVERFLAALDVRAAEAGIERADVLAVLARRPEIGAAFVRAAEGRRAAVGRER